MDAKHSHVIDETPLSQITGLADASRTFFRTGKTRPLAWRKTQLRALITALLSNEKAIEAAMHADLRRPQFEAVRVVCQGASSLTHTRTVRVTTGDGGHR